MSDIPADVIGRAAADETFRSELLSDPDGANEKYSLGLSDDQIKAISELDPEVIEDSLAGGGDLSAE